MKKLGLAAAAVAALIGMQAPATATDVSFISTLTASSTPFCVLGSCALQVRHGVQSTEADLGLNDSTSFYLGSISVASGFGGDTDAALDLQLTFLSPDAGSSQTGALVQYLHAFGRIFPGVTGGSVTWDDPAFDFSIGDYSYELTLQNLSGFSIGSPTALYATLELTGIPQAIIPPSNDQPASAVPEPASWALMLGGFGLMGAAMRRRKVSFA